MNAVIEKPRTANAPKAKRPLAAEAPKPADVISESATTASPEFCKLSKAAVEHAWMKVSQAIHLLELFADSYGQDEIFGLLRLAETLRPEITALIDCDQPDRPSFGDLNDLAVSLAQVTEVIGIVNDCKNDTGLHCVVSLLEMADSIVVKALERLSSAQAYERGQS